jgi:hypothetical protein
MPVRLIEPQDIRSFCFQTHFSNATKRTYLWFCRMLFTWMEHEGYVVESVAGGSPIRRRRIISLTRP